MTLTRTASGGPGRRPGSVTGRTAAVLVATGVLLAGSCGGSPPARPELPAWDQLASRIEGGVVSRQLALDAFATILGPIPGGHPVAAEELGTPSGTAALRWVMGHWDQLEPAQRDAVHARLGLDPAGSPRPGALGLRSGQSKALLLLGQVDGRENQILQEMTERVAADLVAQHPVSLPPVLALTTHEPGGTGPEVYATTMPVNPADDGGWRLVERGSFDTCVIMLHPPAMRLFERVQGGTAPPLQLRAILAHELVHCHQMNAAPRVQMFYGNPPWIVEGSAAWGGLLYAYPDQPSPTPGDTWWDAWYARPGPDLFDRSYDAIGFWSQVEPLAAWPLLRLAMEGGHTSLEVFDRGLSARSRFLARWATGYVRDANLGPDWYATGPGVGGQAPARAAPTTLGPGETQALPTRPGGIPTARSFDHADLRFRPEVQIVRVRMSAWGAIHWGGDPASTDDLLEPGSLYWYCVDPAGCACPSGDPPSIPPVDSGFASVALAGRASRQAMLAFTGHPDPPQVWVQTDTVASLASTICLTPDDEDEPDPLDLPDCGTWLSEAELMAAVPGANHVVTGTGILTEDPDLTVAFCDFDLVRNPQDAAPWFDWDIYLQVVLSLGERVADPAWEAGARPPGCVDQPLPGGTAGCVRERPGSVDVRVRVGPLSYLSVSATVTTTAGAPDLPASQLREAATAIAELVVARSP
jgi:hypothetical protein